MGDQNQLALLNILNILDTCREIDILAKDITAFSFLGSV